MGMSLQRIFGLYTISFLGVTVLIGIGEAIGLFSNQMIGWIFMALSLAIYVVIGILTRTSNPDQYYVAGRGVPAVFNGMATGSDWMSAASFISMGGALSATFSSLSSSVPICGSSAPIPFPTFLGRASGGTFPGSSA